MWTIWRLRKEGDADIFFKVSDPYFIFLSSNKTNHSNDFPLKLLRFLFFHIFLLFCSLVQLVFIISVQWRAINWVRTNFSLFRFQIYEIDIIIHASSHDLYFVHKQIDAQATFISHMSVAFRWRGEYVFISTLNWKLWESMCYNLFCSWKTLLCSPSKRQMYALPRAQWSFDCETSSKNCQHTKYVYTKGKFPKYKCIFLALVFSPIRNGWKNERHMKFCGILKMRHFAVI